jgi:hypothetical protein
MTIEGWATLIFFVGICIILGYGMLNMQPEPTMGWQCTKCPRKAIGMKTKVDEAGWDVEDPFLCPNCK